MNEVWTQTVDDGRFRCWVERVDDETYQGVLHVEVVETGERLLDKGVGLAYGAMFGPDVDDVAQWQAESIKIIDAWIAAR